MYTISKLKVFRKPDKTKKKRSTKFNIKLGCNLLLRLYFVRMVDSPCLIHRQLIKILS